MIGYCLGGIKDRTYFEFNEQLWMYKFPIRELELCEIPLDLTIECKPPAIKICTYLRTNRFTRNNAVVFVPDEKIKGYCNGGPAHGRTFTFDSRLWEVKFRKYDRRQIPTSSNNETDIMHPSLDTVIYERTDTLTIHEEVVFIPKNES